MKKFFIVLSTLFFISACTNLQKNETQTQPVLEVSEVANTEYELTNIFPNQGLTLGFDNQNRIFGYSGLNRFFGKANIENGSIKIEQLASTRMGGGRDALIREDQYLNLLRSMTTIQKENNQLILSNYNGEKLIFSVK